MDLKIQIQEIDYDAIAKTLYPSLKENIRSSNGGSKKTSIWFAQHIGGNSFKGLIHNPTKHKK